jgi:hypothetical protein
MLMNEVINIAQICGARVFEFSGKTRIVIADNGASGDGTAFIHKFAGAIETIIRREYESVTNSNEDKTS